MNLLELASTLEESSDFHLARLLTLLRVFAGASGEEPIEGITKLVKLDFLLRYPVLLERALLKRGGNPAEVKVQPHERQSVESRMVRYRFGPWDHRYHQFVNTLVAKGLAHVALRGRTVVIGITKQGEDLADRLIKTESFTDLANRSRLLKRYCNLSATNLMEFIYDTFPEISSLRLGEEIAL
jgi:hypothetical protein